MATRQLPESEVSQTVGPGGVLVDVPSGVDARPIVTSPAIEEKLDQIIGLLECIVAAL